MKKELNRVERAGLKVLFNQFLESRGIERKATFFMSCGYFCSEQMAEGYPIHITLGMYLSWIGMREDGTTIMGVESASGDYETTFEFTPEGKYF